MEHPENSDLTVFLARYSLPVQELARQARQHILDTLPGMQEYIDSSSNILAYGSSPKYRDLICAVALYKGYANLIFARGVDLPDPRGLLSGTGKRARHVTLRTQQDVASPGVTELLLAAVRLPTRT